jgi:hypothetical protein
MDAWSASWLKFGAFPSDCTLGRVRRTGRSHLFHAGLLVSSGLDRFAFDGCKLCWAFERGLGLGRQAEIFPSLASLVAAWHSCWLRQRSFRLNSPLRRIFRSTGHRFISGLREWPVGCRRVCYLIIRFVWRARLSRPPTFLARRAALSTLKRGLSLRRTSDDNFRRRRDLRNPQW